MDKATQSYLKIYFQIEINQNEKRDTSRYCHLVPIRIKSNVCWISHQLAQLIVFSILRQFKLKKSVEFWHDRDAYNCRNVFERGLKWWLHMPLITLIKDSIAKLYVFLNIRKYSRISKILTILGSNGEQKERNRSVETASVMKIVPLNDIPFNGCQIYG